MIKKVYIILESDYSFYYIVGIQDDNKTVLAKKEHKNDLYIPLSNCKQINEKDLSEYYLIDYTKCLLVNENNNTTIEKELKYYIEKCNSYIIDYKDITNTIDVDKVLI